MRQLLPSEVVAGRKCKLLLDYSCGAAGGMLRMTEHRETKYVNVLITDDPNHTRDRIIVKFLDPEFARMASGDGGYEHNSVYPTYLYSDEPIKPYTTNTLGDFPKKPRKRRPKDATLPTL